MSQKNGSSPKVLQSSRSSSSSSSYSSSKENAEEKVKRKVNILLEAENPVPIIARIKSLGYLVKILALLDERIKEHFLVSTKTELLNVIDKILNRIVDILIKITTDNNDILPTIIAKIESLGYLDNISKQFRNRINDAHDKDEKDIIFNTLNNIYKIEDILRKEAQFIAYKVKELTIYAKKLDKESQRKTLDTPLLEDINTILSIFTNNPQKIDKQKLQSTIERSKSHLLTLRELVKKESSPICSRILTPKQVGQTCWFMASFVAMFYSQHSRKIILDASKTWNRRKRLFRLLQFVLNNKYRKADNEAVNYQKHSDNIFVDILKLLYKEDPTSFPYNPIKSSGGFFEIGYICKLYNLLGIDYRVFDNIVETSTLAYSYYNKEYDLISYDNATQNIKGQLNPPTYKNDFLTPTILMIRVVKKSLITDTLYEGILRPNTKVDTNMEKQLTSMGDEICYNGKVYILDSVILNNFNKRSANHSIAGITCEGYRYIYNGWTRESMDPVMPNQIKNIPCELMPHDWNVRRGEGSNFCLDTSTCIPDIWEKSLNKDAMIMLTQQNLCFNFSTGERILIYVLQDTPCVV